MVFNLVLTTWPIWESLEKSTLLASDFVEMALFDAVIGHISSNDSEAAALNARLNPSVALFDVFDCITIGVNLRAARISTFELERQDLILDISVDCTEFDGVIALTFLRAVLIVGSPWIDAPRTEECLAATALDRILDHHGADSAHKKVRLLPKFLIILNQIGNI